MSALPELAGFTHEKFHYGYEPTHFMVPPKETDYGMQWPEDTDQLTKELYGYKVGGIGGIRKFDHLINAIRLKWPDGGDGRNATMHCIDFCKHGIINTGLLRVLWACCYEKDLGVAGSASSGKTRPIAAYVIVDWECAPHETLTFICTTSMGASEDRIYGAIVQLHKHATMSSGKLLDYKKCIVFGGHDDSDAADREYNNAIKALAIETGLEGKKAIDTTRGRKNKRVRLIIDELPEMGSYVIQARVNLASNRDFQFIGIGNPCRMDDAHGELCRPDHPDGYSSVSKDVPEWKTRTGKCIFLSGEWSPNFLVNENDPQPFPYLTSYKMLADMLRLCYGNHDSVEYMRNAIGFWASTHASMTVLHKTLIEAYGGDVAAQWGPGKSKNLCALDVGFTVGGDKCVAHFGRLAPDAVSGRTILAPYLTKVYSAKQGEIFEYSIARQVVDDLIANEVEPSCFGMDIMNDGGKIAKAIIEYWSGDKELKKQGKNNPEAYLIYAISSGGKATERIVSDLDPVPCSKRYDRRVTEYWMSVRNAILCGVLRGIDTTSKYVYHFCTRIYEKRKNEQIYLETKDEMKQRLAGGESPDDGDAFSYLVEVARQQGLEFITEEAYRRRIDERMRTEAMRANHIVPTQSKKVAANYESDSWGED